MQYYAHGKLLLSGEYLVLKGSRALAIPTRYGQSLTFSEGNNHLRWKSFDHQNQIWFEAVFSEELEILSTSSDETADFLLNILKKATMHSGKPLPMGELSTNLQFPRNWGLGSSSTLTHLIAQWMKVDPYRLFFDTQNGSGYDVACGSANGPIIYTRTATTPDVKTVNLPKVFEDVFFVHLNKKQNSRPAVTNFLQSDVEQSLISKLSELTIQMVSANSRQDLMTVMNEHELLMSTVLQTKPVKEMLFADFDGSVKSLGAWGGDFVMALGNNVAEYFTAKGYSTVIPFHQMI